MGSSARKKAEKKKDFKVRFYLCASESIGADCGRVLETKAAGWKREGKARQLYRHQLQVKMYEEHPFY